MPDETPLVVYRDRVRAEWVDYNRHLRDAFYLLLFSYATDVLIERIGLDDAARTARARSIYTLEAHVDYLHEIKEGAPVRVEVRVLAHDTKRLHVYLEMFTDARAEPVAAGEQMLLHVDTSGPKATAFDADIAARIEALVAAQSLANLPPAKHRARAIGLPPPRPR